MFNTLLKKSKEGILTCNDVKEWVRATKLSYDELLKEEYAEWQINPGISTLLAYATIADFFIFESIEGKIQIDKESEVGKYLDIINEKLDKALKLIVEYREASNIKSIINELLNHPSLNIKSTSERSYSGAIDKVIKITELVPIYAGTKVKRSYQGRIFSIIKGISFPEELRQRISEAINKEEYEQQKRCLIEAAEFCMQEVEELRKRRMRTGLINGKLERISNYIIKASLFLNAALVLHRKKLLKVEGHNLTEAQYISRTQLPCECLDNSELEIIQSIILGERMFLEIIKDEASEQTLPEKLALQSTTIEELWDDTAVINKNFLEYNIRDYVAREMTSVDFKKETFKPGYLTEAETRKVQEIYYVVAEGIKKGLLRKIIDDVIKILGKPPCLYSVLCLGSLAREEATPYSDLELAILIDKDNPENRLYFYKLAVLITLQVQNLGETAIPKDLFKLGPLESFDEVIKPGLMLDLGGKTPLGRIDQGYSLIQIPEKMAEYIKDESFKLGELLPIEMVTFNHVYGNEELSKRYYDAVHKILETKGDRLILRQQRALKLLKRDIEDKRFDPNLYSEEEEGKLLKVKEEIYRLPNLILDSLALYYGIHGGCSKVVSFV